MQSHFPPHTEKSLKVFEGMPSLNLATLPQVTELQKKLAATIAELLPGGTDDGFEATIAALKCPLTSRYMLDTLDSWKKLGQQLAVENQEQLLEQYSMLVASKVTSFPQLPKEEQNELQRLSPDVDLKSLAETVLIGKLQREDVATALEDPSILQALVARKS